MKRPSVSLLLDKRRMKEGFASVKLSVYYNAQQKQYAAGIILDDKQVEFLTKKQNWPFGKVRNEGFEIYGTRSSRAGTVIHVKNTKPRRRQRFESQRTWAWGNNIPAATWKAICYNLRTDRETGPYELHGTF